MGSCQSIAVGMGVAQIEWTSSSTSDCVCLCSLYRITCWQSLLVAPVALETRVMAQTLSKDGADAAVDLLWSREHIREKCLTRIVFSCLGVMICHFVALP